MPSRRRTSIRTRILVASAVGAVACAALVLVLTVLAIFFVTSHDLSDLRTLEDGSTDRCLADPDDFVIYDGLFRIFAYGLDGQSAHPKAPELDPSWLVTLPRTHSQRFMLPGGPWWRRGAIQQVADDGPCAVFYGVPPPQRESLVWVRGTSAVAAFLGLVGALMATALFAVRPLMARLARLDRAAASVGTPGFHSASDPGDDELGRVSATLDEAHHRIVADRAERVRRHLALEHHLASVAHDLRTPLASLALLLEDLSARGAQSAGARSDLIRDARFEVAYLEALADNLHQATRMASGLAADDGEVDLVQVVNRVESRFAILGRLLGGTVAAAIPDEPVWARCRPALAERALANLVHNGVIHGTGDVGIVLTGTDDRFTIVVRSAGPVLAPALVQRLARRRLGAQTDPSRSRREDDRHTQSRGLGLAIVNAVAESARFDVRYTGPEDGGLSVTLSGPRLVRPTGEGGR